jgi:hypothetical protein
MGASYQISKTPFFYFSVGCGDETIFLYVGWGGLLKINYVGGGIQ